jgi:hypothetical protein
MSHCHRIDGRKKKISFYSCSLIYNYQLYNTMSSQQAERGETSTDSTIISPGNTDRSTGTSG